MRLSDVLAVLDALVSEGVRCWIEGGWGVDALVGRQTRAHRDLDIDVDADQEDVVLEVLSGLGYEIETDWRPTRVELVRVGTGWVDVHPLRFDSAGDARQAAPDGTFWHIPRHFFTTGGLEGRNVECYTAAAQREFRRGYELRSEDRHDLAQLDRLDDARRASADERLPPRP